MDSKKYAKKESTLIFPKPIEITKLSIRIVFSPHNYHNMQVLLIVSFMQCLAFDKARFFRKLPTKVHLLFNLVKIL